MRNFKPFISLLPEISVEGQNLRQWALFPRVKNLFDTIVSPYSHRHQSEMGLSDKQCQVYDKVCKKKSE